MNIAAARYWHSVTSGTKPILQDTGMYLPLHTQPVHDSSRTATTAIQVEHHINPSRECCATYERTFTKSGTYIYT